MFKSLISVTHRFPRGSWVSKISFNSFQPPLPCRATVTLSHIAWQNVSDQNTVRVTFKSPRQHGDSLWLQESLLQVAPLALSHPGVPVHPESNTWINYFAYVEQLKTCQIVYRCMKRQQILTYLWSLNSLSSWPCWPRRARPPRVTLQYRRHSKHHTGRDLSAFLYFKNSYNFSWHFSIYIPQGSIRRHWPSLTHYCYWSPFLSQGRLYAIPSEKNLNPRATDPSQSCLLFRKSYKKLPASNFWTL